jgi:CRISPR-associated protein Csm5
MKYRVTCLTPVLVGDGDKLSAIDYMVWKDAVNVLDQNRIFKLLSKGPRLDGYLMQLKKAEKLDFASWGGFAQNFAGRRIPFEHASSSEFWNRAQGDSLNIPTFSAGASGPYLPGAAIKGALRTGVMFTQSKPGMLNDVLQRVQGDRLPRRPAEVPEDQALGPAGHNRMRAVSAGDSRVVQYSQMRVYLLRVSTLQTRGQGAYSLAWKQSPRGAVNRPEDATPAFAEMSMPGSAFEGVWDEKTQGTRARIFDSANKYARQMIAEHRKYAEWTGLDGLGRQLTELESRLDNLNGGSQCLLSIGWGGGLLSKTAWLDKDSEEHRKLLGYLPLYSRAIASGMPFPKTRRIVFQENKPATLPGWCLLEVG